MGSLLFDMCINCELKISIQQIKTNVVPEELILQNIYIINVEYNQSEEIYIINISNIIDHIPLAIPLNEKTSFFREFEYVLQYAYFICIFYATEDARQNVKICLRENVR